MKNRIEPVNDAMNRAWLTRYRISGLAFESPLIQAGDIDNDLDWFAANYPTLTVRCSAWAITFAQTTQGPQGNAIVEASYNVVCLN